MGKVEHSHAWCMAGPFLKYLAGLCVYIMLKKLNLVFYNVCNINRNEI